ncbi:C39 family peptidase [Spirochaeta cellobiosiphila]|uniref:C39 family peptidase n=1 Tax=Spirochaeta cellobiosiphila TaxID=504483 RepID=UPI0005632D06|nr:C39 family peptidase [Spirochaeta cellobiosiphila]
MMTRLKLLLIGLFIFVPILSVVAKEVTLDIPYYAQGKDSPWADELLGNKSKLTIRSHGCALTCITMIVDHYSPESLTPDLMNDWLKTNNGYQDGWEGTDYLGEVVLNWPALASYGKGYVYTRLDWKAQPADILLIKYYLDQKVPVIGEVLYHGAPHYIVLTGYDEKGFLMNDPEFPEEHRMEAVYNISDKWGSGPSRNIYGIRVLYPTKS